MDFASAKVAEMFIGSKVHEDIIDKLRPELDPELDPSRAGSARPAAVFPDEVEAQ